MNVGDNDSGLRANGDGSVAFCANNTKVAAWNNNKLQWLKDVEIDGMLKAKAATFGGNIAVSWGGRTAHYHENGDVTGPVWGGALSAWLNNQLNSRGTKNTANRAINGWWKRGDTGLIIQWGKTDSESFDRKILPLPLPFPNEGLWALGWVAEAIGIGEDQCSHSAGLVDKAHIKVTTDYNLATAWIAIGY